MKIDTSHNNEKQSQILRLLQFGTVMVFVDSRHPKVIVPDGLKGDFQLRLNFDYAYDIPDFRVLTDRLEASLSFDHRDFFCVLPFDAIYLIVAHSIQHGILFPTSIPNEMLEYFAQEADKQDNTSSEPQFSVINGRTLDNEGDSSHNLAEPKPKRVNHLRLVK